MEPGRGELDLQVGVEVEELDEHAVRRVDQVFWYVVAGVHEPGRQTVPDTIDDSASLVGVATLERQQIDIKDLVHLSNLPNASERLRRMPKTDWNPILRAEFDKPYWEPLQRFVAEERTRHVVYPPTDEVFAALHLTPYADIRVLILGQDPYHGPRQAHGLCFSVRRGVRQPPSLVNIYAELHADLGIEPADHGNLDAWA